MTLWGKLEGGKEVSSNQSTDSVSEPASCTHRCFSPTASSIEGVGIFLPITKLHYDIHAATTLQSFVVPELQPNSQTSFRVVVLQVHSNWGGNSTCLYRVGIYGHGET